MNFYEENLETIKKYKKDFYDEVVKYDISSNLKSSIKVSSVNTKEDVQALVIEKEDKEYRMNSIFYPVKEAERWVKQYSFCNLENIISMFGFGNGLFASQVMKNMNSNDRFVIYEPSVQVFFYVLQHYNLKKIIMNSNVIIVVKEINEHIFHNFLQTFVNLRNVKTNSVLTHPNYDKIFIEEAIIFWKEVKDNYIHTIGIIGTGMHFGKACIENVLGNMKYLKDCVNVEKFIKNANKNIPVVLVAAGPSLEDNIENLKKIKGKAIIIAVDRILEYLLNNNVIPDIIATIDPLKPMEYFPKNDNITIPLLCLYDSNTKLWEKHKGKKIIASTNGFMIKIYHDMKQKPQMCNTGGSVATMIFGAVVSMGFKTIILVGQDLAYRGEYTHAGEVAEKIGSDILVDGVDGNKATSRLDWYEFIVWYQDFIKATPDLCVYDTKSTGAKIKGTILKPFSEILLDYTENDGDIEKLINSLVPQFTQSQLEDIKKYLDVCEEDLENIKKKAQEAQDICEGLLKEWERNKNTSVISKTYTKDLKNIMKQIEKRNIYKLLENYVTAFSTNDLSNIYKFTEEEEENKKNTYNISMRIFKCIEEACDFTIPILVKNRENIMI